MIEIQPHAITPELKQRIQEGFAQHAQATIGYDEKLEPISFVATYEGEFAGAIVIALFWGALHLKYLYVEEAQRSLGIGTRLLQEACEYGRAHFCPFIFVETMSFQALDFYRKGGFQLEYTRPGYSHGTSFHYLRKDL